MTFNTDNDTTQAASMETDVSEVPAEPTVAVESMPPAEVVVDEGIVVTGYPSLFDGEAITRLFYNVKEQENDPGAVLNFQAMLPRLPDGNLNKAIGVLRAEEYYYFADVDCPASLGDSDYYGHLMMAIAQKGGFFVKHNNLGKWGDVIDVPDNDGGYIAFEKMCEVTDGGSALAHYVVLDGSGDVGRQIAVLVESLCVRTIEQCMGAKAPKQAYIQSVFNAIVGRDSNYTRFFLNPGFVYQLIGGKLCPADKDFNASRLSTYAKADVRKSALEYFQYYFDYVFVNESKELNENVARGMALTMRHILSQPAPLHRKR